VLGMPVGPDEEFRQFPVLVPVLGETARRFLELGEEWKPGCCATRIRCRTGWTVR
jgi:hypothetical protein